MSHPKVKIAVLKNLLIFGEKYLPQSVRLLEGGEGVETLFGRMPFEHAFSLHGSSLTQKATQVFKGEANISKMNKHLNKQTIGKSFDATTGALALVSQFSGDLQDLH